MPHRYISSLRVVDNNGNDKTDEFAVPVPIGKNIVLASGANISVSTQDSGIQLSCGYGEGEDDPSVRAKYDDIINGAGGFSGAPYWISTVNIRSPFDGSLFLGVDRCFHAGLFDIPPYPEMLDHQLSIVDTCPACTDCPEYETLQDHIVTVGTAIDGQKDEVLDPTKMLDQYMKTVEQWNYVVFLKSWRFNAEATGNEIHASCKYTNHTKSAIPAGLRMEIIFEFAPSDLESQSSDDIDDLRPFVIDTAVKGTITRADLITGTEDIPIRLAYLETTAPLLPTDGIRFYIGGLSSAYIGSDRRVKATFKLTVPSGGTGNFTTIFNTNKMVVIPDSTWA